MTGLSRLDWFNQLPDRQAAEELLAACHSRRWAERVAAGRPYADLADLQQAADEAWLTSTRPTGWRRSRPTPASASAAAPRPSGRAGSREQAGVGGAGEDVRAAIAAYEQRFGHVYLVSAAGRGAGEILAGLQARLGSDPMGRITTHVLDTARGRPAAGVRVTLEARDGDGWSPVGEGVTDADGRVPGLAAAGDLRAGVHRLTFHTGDCFDAQGVEGFYPVVTVVCRIQDPAAHYHVPLLLSPWGYSTYRGS